MFAWLGSGLMLALLGMPALFILWPYVGPWGMLVSFALAFTCIFRGMFVGHRAVIEECKKDADLR